MDKYILFLNKVQDTRDICLTYNERLDLNLTDIKFRSSDRKCRSERAEHLTSR